MDFLKKYLLQVATLVLVVIGLGLYFFLVRPVMVKRQEVIKETEEKLAQLRKYSDNPPSPEMIVSLEQEKETLESQYEEVIRTLNFAQRVPLPEEIGKLHLYFEEQIEKMGNEFGRGEETAGIKIPDRLGFGREKPRSREELSALLSQLASAKELVSLVTAAGVSELSLLNPLPLAEDRFMKMSGKPLLEELKFELGVRAEISALTKLLYLLANDSYFFTVKDLKVRSVLGKRRETPSLGEEQGERRRRRRRVPAEGLLEKKSEEEKTTGEVELEVKLLVATQLLLPLKP